MIKLSVEETEIITAGVARSINENNSPIRDTFLDDEIDIRGYPSSPRFRKGGCVVKGKGKPPRDSSNKLGAFNLFD